MSHPADLGGIDDPFISLVVQHLLSYGIRLSDPLSGTV
jgi:hypothetical protein